MAELRDLLIELGTEELPPKALTTLADALQQGVVDGLVKAGLAHGEVKRYCAPRRLALLIRDLPTQQPDRTQERRGPALAAAYKEGQPTPALQGFARSCGVTVDELQVQETDKGSWLVHISRVPGANTAQLVPAILDAALAALPIPKRMRWGSSDAEFVRPVHWLVLLFGEQVIPAQVLGISSGRDTYGHRFHHPQALTINRPSDYANVLYTQGKVVADFEQRRATILAQTQAAAQQAGGRAVIQPALLDEVTALVEWPVALVGSFDTRFLAVPQEALISTMQDNQKYFPLVDADGRLLPRFIFIANLESRDPAQIIAGNERVIRPRFSDAEFFWQQDRKAALADKLDALKSVVFQQKLGSVHDKAERVATLARLIAQQCGGNPDWAYRAGLLSKCDLLTNMVQEFPELQGIMGRYYASHDGEASEVASALEQQYWPRFAGDALPNNRTAQAVALADRLDSVLGIFAIGQIPSGTKDPFALRRAALGVLRICIETGLALDLHTLLEHAARHFPPQVEATKAVPAVLEFVLERLRAYYAEQGMRPDELEAVLECRPTQPVDFDQRLRAVAQFRTLPESAALAAANKRIRNILKKQAEPIGELQSALLQEPAEQQLAAALTALEGEVTALFDAGNYSAALQRLASLREVVDNFFEQVMVMAEDATIRANRLALLDRLAALFLRVADFSRLQD